ncbi:MAG: exosortase/archaeosortase family protein [Verrucomicrobium sp.]|nr:exosortase/archaeosortase family protein [Verrucomicrobium sp.]
MAAWTALGLVLTALFAVFPYTTSHLNHLVPLAQAAWYMWTHFPDFEHGLLVAPLAAFLVWQKRAVLAALPRRGSGWGLAVLLLGFLAYLLGYLADIQYVGFFSLNLVLAGAILWLGGVAWMRALAFPWAFLFFMWPMPFLDNLLAFPLRLAMAQASHLVLAAVGVDNLCLGTAILSAPAPGHPAGERFAVDVADPCSGIRSLFALLMLAALYGHYALDRTWKKWALFLAAIPLAVAGNMARIVVLAFGILLWGAPFAVGTLDQPTWFHMLAGYVVFAVALAGMAACAKALALKGSNRAGAPGAAEAPRSAR